MAHLRYAMIAWLSLGIREPGILLSHLNQLSRQLTITATAAVALYDPATRIMRWARAGHPPPLLARAGTGRALERPDGILLGAVPEPVYAVLAPQLEVGDLVLFFTDGLIERRSRNTDELLDQVKQTLAAASTEPAGDGLGRLPARLPTASPDDDTCTMVIQVLP